MKNFYRSLCLVAVIAWHSVSMAQVPILNSYPAANAVIFLDFDGHTVEGTSWNFFGPIPCGASGLDAPKITEVFNRVAEDFRPFNINVTTDSTLFLAAPVKQRMRVILTVSSSWYGVAGGVAFVGSFTWGDDTPCFIFTALHSYRIKDIAEATSHEAGHTLGLYHQSRYDASCNKVSDYHSGQGSGEIGWAPIMGTSYTKNFTLWNYGPNTYGCTNMQSDLDIITHPANGFGYRPDDHGSTFATATQPVFSSQMFEVKGVIQQNTDQDMFRFIMPGSGRFELDAIPYNVGTGNAGSDLDMQVTLYGSDELPLSVYNPGTLLNSVVDTILGAGTYYLKVEGKGNLYAPAYASLGSYSMAARIDVNEDVLPVRRLELQGSKQGDVHQLNWIITADEKLEELGLEVSTDGRSFHPLYTPTTESRSYIYRPVENPVAQYRLRAVFANGARYYSNTVRISDDDRKSNGPRVISNLLDNNTVHVSSPGNFDYAVMDMNGKMMTRGRVVAGNNSIELRSAVAGMYIIRFDGNNQQWTEKLIRR